MNGNALVLFIFLNIFVRCESSCHCVTSLICDQSLIFEELGVNSSLFRRPHVLQWVDIPIVSGEDPKAFVATLPENYLNTKDTSRLTSVETQEQTYACDDRHSMPNVENQKTFSAVLTRNITSNGKLANIFNDIVIIGLSAFQPEWFKNPVLKYLRGLFIIGAEIQSLDKDVFKDLKFLNILDLSDNYIKTIHSDTFSNLLQLETLNLSGNNITSIDQNIFATLNIKNLFMTNNACADENIFDLNKTDIVNDLSNCFKFYRPRDIINEDQNYQWINELNKLQVYVEASLEEALNSIIKL